MIVGVGVVIERPDGAILLGLRAYPGQAECWCLPGGKLDPGERFEVAARRETAEETGIELTEGLDARAVIVTAEAGDVCVICYVEARVTGEVEAGLPEPEKFREWRWFDPRRLPSVLFGPTAAVLAVRAGAPLPESHVYPISAGN